MLRVSIGPREFIVQHPGSIVEHPGDYPDSAPPNRFRLWTFGRINGFSIYAAALPPRILPPSFLFFFLATSGSLVMHLGGPWWRIRCAFQLPVSKV